jgi:hypothetical protein
MDFRHNWSNLSVLPLSVLPLSVSARPNPKMQLVTQIHTHCEPLSIGARHTFPPSSFARLFRSGFEFLAQLCHQFCHHLLGIPLDRTTRLSRLAGSIGVSPDSCCSFSQVNLLNTSVVTLTSASITQRGNATEIDLLISSSDSMAHPCAWSEPDSQNEPRERVLGSATHPRRTAQARYRRRRDQRGSAFGPTGSVSRLQQFHRAGNGRLCAASSRAGFSRRNFKDNSFSRLARSSSPDRK